MDIFDRLRQKWYVYLTGSGNNGKIYSEAIDNINLSAKKSWESMNKSVFGLWNDCTSTVLSEHVTKGYKHIENMALSYSVPNSIYYKNENVLNDILYALEWYYENRYNEKSDYYDNWWHWDIGVPQVLCNIVILIYDKLNPEQTNRYMDAIERFDYTPLYNRKERKIATGANRADLCKIVILRGIIVKDADKIKLAMDVVEGVFEYITEGEGFYRDGSFIQHINIPYNCSYGMVLIMAISELVYILADTTWQFDSLRLNIICEWIYNSFLPFIHKGRAMDCVRGRAVSRSFLEDNIAGRNIIQSIANISLNVPQKIGDKLKGIVKQLLISDAQLPYYKSDILYYVSILEDIYKDENIKVDSLPPKHYHFAMMDRVVHKTKKFDFVISMYSERIQNYEDMLDENKKAWHTSDGCTYIYNDDLSSYNNGFWATVNPYRLSGTTADARELPVIPKEDGAGFQQTSLNSWVGGCYIDDLYGCAGMELSTPFSTLKCKKSWFMFQSRIICLGSDINSDDENRIETIIENRKIDETYSVELLNDKTIYLRGGSEGKNIGYAVLDDAIPNIIIEDRKGSWHDINWSMGKEEIQNTFMTIFIDHGIKPKNQSYAYAILPCADVQDLKNEIPVDIIRRDEYAHALFDRELNIMAINFWRDEPARCANVLCSKKASIMMRETGDEIKISISDPTMKNNDTIIIELFEKVKSVVSKDDKISCEIFDDNVKIETNVCSSYGQPLGIIFKK